MDTKAIFTPGHWVVSWSEAHNRTTPSRPGRLAGQYGPKSVRTSRKTIPEALGSSGFQNVSSFGAYSLSREFARVMVTTPIVYGTRTGLKLCRAKRRLATQPESSLRAGRVTKGKTALRRSKDEQD